MEQYLALTRGNQAPGVVKLAIRNNVNFEIKSQFMMELKEIRMSMLMNMLRDFWTSIPSGTINTWDLLKNAFIHRSSSGQGLPTPEEVKRVVEFKYGEFGRSLLNNGVNGGTYHVGPPRYYTRVDNRPPFGERKPSLKELMNKHIEESTKRRNKNEEWMKKLQETKDMNIRNQNATLKNQETQVNQLAKDFQAKAAKEAPISSASIGHCKTIFADNEAPSDETSSNGSNKLHRVSFISDDVGQFTGRKGKTKMVKLGMATLRLHSCRPIRMMGNGTCKFWPTCDPNLKECNRGDSIYGVDKRGVLKQWYGNNKIDDTARARRYEEWLAKNNKHMSYGSTSMPYLGDYAIAPREITDPDHKENPILSIKSYFPNFSQQNYNKPRPRDYSFKEWLKVKIGFAMSSDNASSAVTYTSVSSDSNGPSSWGIPLVNVGELPEMDPYEEVAQQGHAHPLSPAYVPDPMELDEHVPVYVPEPEHPRSYNTPRLPRTNRYDIHISLKDGVGEMNDERSRGGSYEEHLPDMKTNYDDASMMIDEDPTEDRRGGSPSSG
ncbi:hypothetical protein Tco_0365665 [Tanacetum coccineum]